jgi:hypothetical protein
MKKVLQVSNSKFPQKTFAVLVVVALVAFLLTLKPVATNLKKLVENLGITFPPLEIFQNTAQNIFDFVTGFILVVLSVIAFTITIKVGLIVSGLALVYYAGMRLYKTFAKGETQNRLPEGPLYPDGKK